MEKIKLITDSACDIPVEDEKRLGITILPIPITIGTEGYYERESFNFDQFYDIVEAAEEIPVTSHILSITYQEEYEKALAQGYTHVIVVTIYSGASNMNFAAHAAISAFYEEHPEAKEKITIEVLDSRTLKMRVWERGSGETWACGTGTCATVVAACLNGHCKKGEEVTVHLRGGDLAVTWLEDGRVLMRGPAEKVFDGVIDIKNLSS